jgi:hypothetical protein
MKDIDFMKGVNGDLKFSWRFKKKDKLEASTKAGKEQFTHPLKLVKNNLLTGLDELWRLKRITITN